MGVNTMPTQNVKLENIQTVKNQNQEDNTVMVSGQ